MVSCSSSDGYRIPQPIHELMFERGPFYARMKTRYTRDHYPMTGVPEYFVSDTEAFDAGDDRSSLELYFGDDNILLSAGGSYSKYYSLSPSNNFWAKPTMLIPRGDFGHPGEGDDPWEWREDSLKDVVDDVMVSPGKVWDWWESECNVWLYRNFVYGYRFHDKHGAGGGDRAMAPKDFSLEHSFYVPEFWEDHADEVRSFFIGDAHFEIYQFAGPDKLRPPPPASADHGPMPIGDGYYIVRAKFRKYDAKKWKYRMHREFSRGFVEIIPRHVFIDAGQLEWEIKQWNNWSFFDGGERTAPWIYVLTMSKEKVVMGSVMGADSFGGEGCDDGILSIHEPDFDAGQWGPPIDMEEWFIPPDVSDSDAMKRVPLITVWKLNSSFEPTGCKLVETVDEGVVVVRRPAEICWQGGGTAACEVWGPGWHCYKIDSRNYKFPVVQMDYQSYDCHCFEP